MTLKNKTIQPEEIKKIMGSAWEISPSVIPADVQFNQFPQWDSFGHVTLLVALEKEYGIKIDFSTLTKLTSINAILDYLNLNSE